MQFFILLRWTQSVNVDFVGVTLISALDDMRNGFWNHRDAIDDRTNRQTQIAA
jgi:hypothetical protein